jgi:OOP family OmpA-OmpF porin
MNILPRKQKPTVTAPLTFDTGIRSLAAVGTEYAFTPNLAGHLEYQWVRNIGNANQIGVSGDASSVMASVVYRFGQED